MGSEPIHEAVIRYRGFLLFPQSNKSWLVRPERSPMLLLPFRTPACSLSAVKAILDIRLERETTSQAA